MVFRVLHHDQCFDGASSAAMFTKFHRECIGGASAYEYRGLAHKPGGGVEDDVFGSGENGIVDFKYSASPRLNWWFDHHQSAFISPADRAHFEQGQRTELRLRQFFNPDYVSCTSFIAATASSHFGFDPSGVRELLYWADIVDGARFASAAMAVEMKEPALQLAMVIEHAGTPDSISRIIPLLTEMPLADVVSQSFIAKNVEPLLQQHMAAMDLVEQRAALKDGVIYLDLLDREIEGLSKFIPYYFYPNATYTIAVTRSSLRTKISVGTNPWTRVEPVQLVNLAEICERFGGGGHARVGAISFQPGEIDRTRSVALGIAQELRLAERQREGR